MVQRMFPVVLWRGTAFPEWEFDGIAAVVAVI